MAAPAQQRDSITSTLELRKRKFQDLLFQKLPLLDGFRSIPGGRDKVDGGAEKAYEVIVQQHSGIVEHSTGYEPTTTSVQEVSQLARFYFYLWSTVIAITKKDKLENSGKAAQVKLLEMRMKAQLGHVMRQFEAHMLQNQGVFNLLGSLDGGSTVGAAANGLLEPDAIGAQTNTIGTLARQTYTPFLDNHVYDIAGVFATNGVEQLNLAMTQTWSYAAPGSHQLLGILSDICFNKYMTEMGTQVRLVKKDKLDVGGVELVTLHGHRLKPSPNLAFNTAAADIVSGYLMDIGGIFEIVNRHADWSIDPPEKVSGQLVLARDMCYHGQLGFQHGMRGSAVILNGEA